MLFSSSIYITAGFFTFHSNKWDSETDQPFIQDVCLVVTELHLFCILSTFVWKFIETVNMCQLTAKVSLHNTVAFKYLRVAQKSITYIRTDSHNMLRDF